MVRRCLPCSEAELIQRILPDDYAFWQLDQYFRPDLEKYIGSELRLWSGCPAGRNGYLIAWTANAVICSLWSRNYKYLRAFKECDGGLAAFLRGLARKRVYWEYMDSRDRRKREGAVTALPGDLQTLIVQRDPSTGELIDPRPIDWDANFTQQEVNALLTSQESSYFRTRILGIPAAEPVTFSTANGWQLEHRIREKVKKVFGWDTERGTGEEETNSSMAGCASALGV